MKLGENLKALLLQLQRCYCTGVYEKAKSVIGDSSSLFDDKKKAHEDWENVSNDSDFKDLFESLPHLKKIESPGYQPSN